MAEKPKDPTIPQGLPEHLKPKKRFGGAIIQSRRPAKIDNLSDVTTVGAHAPLDGDLLAFDTSATPAPGQWVPRPTSAISHDSFADLDTDSHPLYSLTDGSRAFTNPVAGVNPAAPEDLATKAYVDEHRALISRGVRTYFFEPSVADPIISGYKRANPNPPAGGEVTTTTSVTGTTPVLVHSFITPTGEPHALLIPPGNEIMHIHAHTGANNEVARLSISHYWRDAGGTEHLLHTSVSDSFFGASPQVIEWTETVTAPTVLVETDRIVYKVYVQRVSGPASFNATLYYEDGGRSAYTYSTLPIPMSLEDLSNVDVVSPVTGQVLQYNNGEWFNGNLTIPKASGNGVYVDMAAPTFPWHDMLGEINIRGAGGADPGFITFRGGIREHVFAVSDEVFINFHLPHDYVKGTDLFIHAHWGQALKLKNNTASGAVTGGSVTWGFEATYAKGHQQAAFGVPITTTAQQNCNTTTYWHHIDEVQLSALSPSAAQLDTALLEPDGVIMVRVYLSANGITVSSGSQPAPFLFFCDAHYQSTGIGTKQKAPDFYT